MAVIYTRGRALKTAIAALFVVVAGASLLTVAVQLVMSVSGGFNPDLGWGVVAGVSTGLAVWATRSQGLLRLLSDADPWAHQGRTRAVWGLLLFVLLLVVGLKTGSPDRDAYKNLVFGEGGLVEWSQVLVLLLATRAAWLIGSDLNARLQERRPRAAVPVWRSMSCPGLDGGARLGPGDLQLADPALVERDQRAERDDSPQHRLVSGTTGSGHLPGDPWGFGCCGSGAALDGCAHKTLF